MLYCEKLLSRNFTNDLIFPHITTLDKWEIREINAVLLVKMLLSRKFCQKMDVSVCKYVIFHNFHAHCVEITEIYSQSHLTLFWQKFRQSNELLNIFSSFHCTLWHDTELWSRELTTNISSNQLFHWFIMLKIDFTKYSLEVFFLLVEIAEYDFTTFSFLSSYVIAQIGFDFWLIFKFVILQTVQRCREK